MFVSTRGDAWPLRRSDRSENGSHANDTSMLADSPPGKDQKMDWVDDTDGTRRVHIFCLQSIHFVLLWCFINSGEQKLIMAPALIFLRKIATGDKKALMNHTNKWQTGERRAFIYCRLG